MSIRKKLIKGMEQYLNNTLLPVCYAVAIDLAKASIDNPQLASSYTLEKYNQAVLERMKGDTKDE